MPHKNPEDAKAYRERTKERRAANFKRWYEANKESRREKSRAARAIWYDKNRETVCQKQREYVERKKQEDPDYFKVRDRAYYEANKERIREKQCAYVAADRETHNARIRRWRKANPHRYMAINARSQLKHPMKQFARNQVLNRVYAGQWPKASFFLCTDCDKQACDYHHPDYDYPLWVEPVCRQCHSNIHTSLRKSHDEKT